MTESGCYLGIQRIISGGQTGVDQAALDVAIELGIPHGGWCPKGRLSENGKIDRKYQLQELPTADYAARTERNVIDSDGTLILYRQRMQGGTALTDRFARQLGKPVLRVRLDRAVEDQRILDWLAEHRLRVLNVAGPRGSSHPDIYRQAFQLLNRLFRTRQLFSWTADQDR